MPKIGEEHMPPPPPERQASDETIALAIGEMAREIDRLRAELAPFHGACDAAGVERTADALVAYARAEGVIEGEGSRFRKFERQPVDPVVLPWVDVAIIATSNGPAAKSPVVKKAVAKKAPAAAKEPPAKKPAKKSK